MLNRKEFIETRTKEKAQEEAPWACKLVRTYGGYLAFESMDDFKEWKNQF
jgi:hypothetical protein